MRGREHLMIGAGTAFLAVLGAQVSGVSITTGVLLGTTAAAAAGSLAPDLDHPWSLASFGIPASLLAYGGVFLLLPLFRSDSGMFAGLFDVLVLSPQYRAAAT